MHRLFSAILTLQAVTFNAMLKYSNLYRKTDLILLQDNR